MTATDTEPLIGVINAGSSSLKFSFDDRTRRLPRGTSLLGGTISA
jgi:acetate kinase